jgi:hypothetical protein
MIKLLNILKEINEAKQAGILYHWTKLKNLKDIVHEDYGFYKKSYNNEENILN